MHFGERGKEDEALGFDFSAGLAIGLDLLW